MVVHESAIELREYLSEHVHTFLFTNYQLEHKGVRLHDFQELASIDLGSHPRIYMRPCKLVYFLLAFEIYSLLLGLYNDNSMRVHITKL